MNKELKKELTIIAILLLLLTIASVTLSVLYSTWLNRIEEKIGEPMVCIPLVKEDYFGDHYFLECLDKEEFDKSFEKAKDPTI